MLMQSTIHAYEVRPRKDHRGVDLISDVLPFDRLWYSEPNAISNTIGYAEHNETSIVAEEVLRARAGTKPK
jgi:hypothetical protein